MPKNLSQPNPLGDVADRDSPLETLFFNGITPVHFLKSVGTTSTCKGRILKFLIVFPFHDLLPIFLI